MATPRRLAWGGIAGPVAFVSAWVAGEAIKAHYSPTDDAISRLAAVGASTRPLMTAGFIAFGIGVPAYAAALRVAVPGRAWLAAAATGIATVGVAAFPLDASPTGDTVHAAFAAAAYAALAATPLLAARPLAAGGRRGAARLSVGAGSVSAVLLAATLAGPVHGLLQRAGLTLGHAWLAVAAAWILAGHDATTPPARRPAP
jgi:hypothetical membrane protein